MKTKLFILLLLIVSCSCGTNNKPLSDALKKKMIAEVQEVMIGINKALEEVNFISANEPCLDSPDFSYTSNGITKNYAEFMEFKTDFDKRLNQKFTSISEKHVVLDESTLLSTSNCKWLINYKDGHSLLLDPWVVQITFKRIDNIWRVINVVESGVAQSVKNTEISNQLNQIELHKQYIGNWECELGKDTVVFWDGKSYGAGLECYFRLVAKGKIVIEGKQIWGYNKKADEFILSELNKGVDNGIYSSYFISKNKCKMLPFGDISNPANASLKWEDEFKSPDMFIHKTLIDDNIVRTDTYTRVKS